MVNETADLDLISIIPLHGLEEPFWQAGWGPAAQRRDNGLDGDQEAVMKGMEEQAEKFRKEGAELYKEV
ncbi:hypothetical protein [Halomonas salipaludis]|uniref:hypothetical protein n=1 Tax=Halomonas salipaludis TaxID=2032625 RepID=UPI001140CAB4|nr:hypothetical protein [Halomonas salipaludis]